MLRYLKILIILTFVTSNCYAQDADLIKPKIAVLYSDLTENYKISNSTNPTDVITTWELFLMQEKVPYKVIYDNDLESGIENDFEILIIPSVEIISSNELNELKKFLAAGKSIFCSGSKLFFKDEDAFNYQNLEMLFNLSNVEAVPSSKIGFIHTLIPNHINKFNLNENVILQISAKNQPLMCDIENKNFYKCGNIYSENSITSDKSSLIYGSVGTGRYLWAGFDLNDLTGSTYDLSEYKSLILNAFKWMDNQPDAYIESFTSNMTAPVLVTARYNNLVTDSFIDSLKQSGTFPHFIVDANQILGNESYSKISNSEIILDLTGYVSGSNLATLADIVKNIKDMYDINIKSILVDYHFIASNDLNEIEKIGINNILYYSPVAGLPKINISGLLLIPYFVINDNADLDNTIKFLNIIPSVDCKKSSQKDLYGKIQLLKDNGHNFTTIDSINNWWKTRSGITTMIKNIKENQFELWLTNKNFVEINDLNIYLDNFNKFNSGVLTISLNNAPVFYYLDDVAKVIVVTLNKISPDSINRIKIQYSLE